MKVVRADTTRITVNRIFRTRNEAILLQDADLVEVSGNMLRDAGRAAANGYDAISVRTSNRILVRDNTAYGTARYAVAVPTGTGITVTGTRWRSMGTGGLTVTASGAVLSDNVGL